MFRRRVLDVRSNFWFLPSLMALAALSLAIVLGAVDRQLGLERDGWLFIDEPEGARELLSVVAASMATVAGVVFSVTILTLSMASAEFGPRLLRNFMRDRGTQVVLGTFTSTFLYSLMVLTRVRTGDEAAVPQLSLGVAIALAVVSIGVLIYFIHHVASSVQPEIVAHKLERDVIRTISHRYAPRGTIQLWDQRVHDQQRELVASAPQDGALLRSHSQGFIQAFDIAGAVELAARRDAVIVFDKSIGDFLSRGTRAGWVLPPDRFSDDLEAEVDRLFILGPHRTIDQDLEFGLEELVDIAVRALSKGISLPFMAAICVNHLRSALVEIIERDPIPPVYLDGQGQVRVIGRATGFASLLETAFGEIRRAGADSMPVVRTILGALSDLGERARTAEQRQALLHQAELMRSAAEARLHLPEERDMLAEHYRAATEVLKSPRPGTPAPASP